MQLKFLMYWQKHFISLVAEDQGLAALFSGPGLPKLESLALRGCAVGDDGLRMAMASPLLARLKRMDLRAENSAILPMRGATSLPFRNRRR